MQNNHTYIPEEHIVNFLHSNRVFQAPVKLPHRLHLGGVLKSSKSLGPVVGSEEKQTTERIPHDIMQSLNWIATTTQIRCHLAIFLQLLE